MRLLLRLVEYMNRQPVPCVLAGAALGMGLAAVARLEQLALLMPLCLFMMLFPAMLQLDMESLRRIRDTPAPFVRAVAANGLIAPLLVWAWASLLAPHLPTPVLQGLVIFGLMPCGSMIPAFTAMARGNVTLTTAVMGACMLGAILAVPLWAGLILGGDVGSPLTLLKQMVLVILLPLALAQAFKRLRKRLGEGRAALLNKGVSLMPGLGLFLISLVMFHGNGDMLFTRPLLLVEAGGPALGHLLALLGTALFSLKLRPLGRKDAIAYLFATGTRNIAASLALTAAAFGQEAALVVVVTGPFIQMPYVITLLGVLRSWGREGSL